MKKLSTKMTKLPIFGLVGTSDFGPLDELDQMIQKTVPPVPRTT